MRKIALLGVLFFAVGSAYAAGPSAVAAPDRSLWPEAVGSSEAFDRASRAELLSFGHALAESESLSDAALIDQLKVKQIDRGSVDRIRAKYWKRLADNYSLASKHCVAKDSFCAPVRDEADFRKLAASFAKPADARYQPWFDDAQRFHHVYLAELLRLAALFPRITSEVDTFSPRELSGNELGDGKFLLTFDDGPTRAGGNTEKMLAVLHEQHLNATFFTLGGNLQSRLQQSPATELAANYKGMCVGAHGWEHKSHASWPDWQSSVTRSIALVHDNLPASFVPLFRPPYGQRLADSGDFFATQGLRVALWNIDSQDWNGKVDADQVKQRVLSLMLLWRHGVILFHDIHPKAQTALPWLVAQTQGTNVQWIDCHGFPPAD